MEKLLNFDGEGSMGYQEGHRSPEMQKLALEQLMEVVSNSPVIPAPEKGK